MSAFNNLVSVKLKSYASHLTNEIVIGEIDKRKFEKTGNAELTNIVRLIEYVGVTEQTVTDPNTKRSTKQKVNNFNLEVLQDVATCSEHLYVPNSEIKTLSFLDAKENAQLINTYSQALDQLKMNRAGLVSANNHSPQVNQ